MKVEWPGSLIVWAVLSTTSLSAAIVPGRWEKVAALEEGYPIIVTMKSGERIKAAFNGLGEEGVLLIKENGEELDLPKAHVVKIESQETRKDSLKNGAMWGAIAGGALGAIAAARPTGNPDVDHWVYDLGAVAVLVGLGVGTGMLIDAGIKSRELFYSDPAP